MATMPRPNAQERRNSAAGTVATHFRLPPDVVEALNQFPPGARTAVVVAALRHYLLPGGQNDLLAALEEVRQTLRNGSQVTAPLQGTPAPGEVQANNITDLFNDFCQPPRGA